MTKGTEFRVWIDYETRPAFRGRHRKPELARILRDVASKLERGISDGWIRDSHGETVGQWGNFEKDNATLKEYSYIDSEFSRLGGDRDEEPYWKVKVTSPRGETRWITIDPDSAEGIRVLLRGKHG